jgi:hypothetical protein
MLGKLARGTMLLFLATMIAFYALSVGKKETAPAQSQQSVRYLFV